MSTSTSTPILINEYAKSRKISVQAVRKQCGLKAKLPGIEKYFKSGKIWILIPEEKIK